MQREKYHHRLRGIFTIINDTHSEIDENSKLRTSIIAINDIMGPEGLVPSLLVFGVFSSLPAGTSSNKTQVERLKAVQLARAEMEYIVAENRIKFY